MPARKSASYNPTLTNFAQGVAQDMTSALAEFLAPTVVVASTVGQYKAYDTKNAFQNPDTARALGGMARRIEFTQTDPTYNAKPHALEVTIDDAEEDAAGAQSASLREGKTKTLISAAMVSREDRVIAKAKTLSAVGSVGVWSNSSNDPISEIDDQIEAIATEIGMMPNAIAFGLGAWRVFRNHPKVVAKFPGAASIGVTPEQAATLMLNPGIQVRFGVLSKDTAKFGSAASKTNIIGAEVFIFLRSPNPTDYDASWMKTFSGGRGSVTSVREYYDERARSQVLAVDWSEDIQITSSISAKRLTIS